MDYKKYNFSASDISKVVTNIYGIKENFDDLISYFVFGSLDQLEKNLIEFNKSKKCKYLYGFYNKSNHWTLYYFLKFKNQIYIYFFDSLKLINTDKIYKLIKNIFKNNIINFYKNNIIKQKDSYNCGVFVIKTFNLLNKNKEYLLYILNNDNMRNPFIFIDNYNFDNILYLKKKYLLFLTKEK